MPDNTKKRGPQLADADLFSDKYLHSLQAATTHLSWLLTNGYAPVSSLKLVGDRFQLRERQRVAVGRSACSDETIVKRCQKQLKSSELKDRYLLVDGFNLLTTVEVVLGNGIILGCRDGCYRDMASMHGAYRTVAQTVPALEEIGRSLEELSVEQCHWLLDRPVSNSGRLCSVIRQVAKENGWQWTAELVDDPDPILVASDHVVVSADGAVLDGCCAWFNLARLIVDNLKQPVARLS